MFKYGCGNWVQYRQLENVVEVDFHYSPEESMGCYELNMLSVWNRSLCALKEAQENGNRFVLFTHGWSTSRIGKTTARSQVRNCCVAKRRRLS